MITMSRLQHSEPVAAGSFQSSPHDELGQRQPGGYTWQ